MYYILLCYIHVHSEPTGVLNLAAIPTSHQSFQVTWDIPQFPNSDITNYIIYYRVRSTVQDVPINDVGYEMVNQTNTLQNIKDLIPFTNYTVHVRAIGNPSLLGSTRYEVVVRTNVTNPTAILNPEAEAISSSAIRVSWNPPSKPNGPISHYVLYYIKGNNRQMENISSNGYLSLNTTNTMLTIAGLDPFTSYRIHVQPFVAEMQYVLEGAIDEEIVMRTFSDVPDFTPTPGQITTVGVTHDNIHILIPNPDQIRTGLVR